MARASSPNELAELSRRLKQLRTEHWPDAGLTQSVLAAAVGVGTPSVSSWESLTRPKVPTLPRLDEYATFFATRRSIERKPARLLSEEELNEDERVERDRLQRELYRLHAAASGENAPLEGGLSSLLHFPDGGPIRIVCGKLPEEELLPYASAADHNYMQLAAYADLDALVELFGHVRSLNPNSDVRYELATRLESDDLQAHLVLLGSSSINQATRAITEQVDLPVRQLDIPKIEDGEVFEVGGDPVRRFGPSFVNEDPPLLIEDVGLFVRTPNPANVSRTLTICSGVFTRGVYGAVRCLTDAATRFGNDEYIASRFGGAETFGFLMRVQVFDHATATPDLNNPTNRLYEWPEVP